MAATSIQDIRDFHDVVRLLEEHPEWRSELRRLILSDELLALPQQLARLTEQVSRLTEQLATLTHDTARRFAAMENDAAANRQAIAELSDAEREHFEELQEQSRTLQHDLHLTQQQVDGLALGVVQLSRRIETNFATLDRRMREQRAETMTAIRLLEKSSSALAEELGRQDERFSRFRTLHHREIAMLMEDTNQLSHWQFTAEYKAALARVSTLLSSLLEFTGPLGSKAANFVANLLGLG